MSDLTNNYTRLLERISAACASSQRDPKSITLLAVSKTKPVEVVTEAIYFGLREFGENYLQDAIEKVQQLQQHALQWHFIGRIQSNKCKLIANQFSWVQTLDRPKIAQRLSDLRIQPEPLNVLIQVNLDDDPNKGGVDRNGAQTLLEQLLTLPSLAPRGLMTILAKSTDSRVGYESVAQLHQDLKQQFAGDLAQWDTLSMGMSADLEEAISAGATMIRVGTDLFGARSN
ncbi:MAG: YggS family pyridoxal phosphate-dependent enzyme [Pseudomonadota bacterium]|nr:YggS family pyridoxal phosphate-dependent enzyme [Pseudomonadota bacterium]